MRSDSSRNSLARFARAAALGAGLAVGAAGAAAQPEHDCEEPEKPEQFQSQDEYDTFIEAAREYMDCLKDFFEEQAQASRAAAEAANAAREEMQRFAASVTE